MHKSPVQAFFFRDVYQSHVSDILKEIYIDRVYEPFLQSRRDLTVLDLGANVGLTAYYFSRYAKRVIAVEPSAAHLCCLRAMVAFNRLNNVEVVPVALSRKCGRATLYHNGNTTMYSLCAAVADQPDNEEVETMSLARILDSSNVDCVDLMKLDIEGGEAELMSEPDANLAMSRVRAIVGEWHSWCGVDREAFASLVVSLGYQFRWQPGTSASIFHATRP